MKNIVKIITISICFIAIACLIVFGIYYASKNYNKGDVKTVDDIPAKYSIKSNQLDKIDQPTVNEKITLDTLPEAKDTIQEIDFKNFKKLFKTSKKSILFLVKDDCSYCKKYLPIVEESLKNMNINAYKININKLAIVDYEELFNYVSFEGTPTTFIIQNSKVLHNLSGDVDKETFESFVDYFYIRNN